MIQKSQLLLYKNLNQFFFSYSLKRFAMDCCWGYYFLLFKFKSEVVNLFNCHSIYTYECDGLYILMDNIFFIFFLILLIMYYFVGPLLTSHSRIFTFQICSFYFEKCLLCFCSKLVAPSSTVSFNT